jgi:hypothetical protein
MTTEDGQNFAFPDTCKTPAAPSPIVLPYPNIAMCSDGDGSQNVKIRGKAVLRKGDKIKRSKGDEAGSLKGVVSSTNMGGAVIRTGCPDVKVEKKEVAHLTSMTGQNGNNANIPPGCQIKPSQSDVKVIGMGTPPSGMTEEELRDFLTGAGVPARFHDGIIGGFSKNADGSVDAQPKHSGTSAPPNQYRAFDSRSANSRYANRSNAHGMTPAKEIGGWLSPGKPTSSLQQIVEMALPLANQANMCAEQKIKKCTFVLEGSVMPQNNTPGMSPIGTGGGIQTYVPGNPGASGFPVSTVGSPWTLPGL